MPINNLHIGRAAAGIHGTLLDGVTPTFSKGTLENAGTKQGRWWSESALLSPYQRQQLERKDPPWSCWPRIPMGTFRAGPPSWTMSETKSLILESGVTFIVSTSFAPTKGMHPCFQGTGCPEQGFKRKKFMELSKNNLSLAYKLTKKCKIPTFFITIFLSNP